MDLKSRIKEELVKLYGVYESGLETKYNEKIIYEIMYNVNKNEWATFNQVTVELKKNLKLRLKLQELLYRLTDEEDPQTVCISILEDIYPTDKELERLYYKIKTFKKAS